MNLELRNKKILVTGGAGFIGSNLCEHLLNYGCEVYCLDNFLTGKIKNIEHIIENKNFTLIEADIRDIDACRNATINIDYVLHQAALGSVPRSIKDPLTTNQVNVDGFLNMLICSKENKVKRFIYAASSSTYGDSKKLPKVEEIIGNPLSPYAITKYVNELYAKIFSNFYGIQTIGLRYFNVYGRRQDPNGAYAAVIPKFVNKLISLESPVINGDGSYSRDFTYIDDVVQANISCILTKNSKAINNVYNIAYGQRNTINDLFLHLRTYLSQYNSQISKVDVIHGPHRDGDIPHSLASVKKAKNLLNYNPKFNLKDGLKEAVRWYWENQKI